jgi:hypothetical protein
VGMVEWREWRTEWSNGRQKWLHTYYLWYTPTPPSTPTPTTTTTAFKSFNSIDEFICMNS